MACVGKYCRWKHMQMKSQTHDSTKVWLHDGPCPLFFPLNCQWWNICKICASQFSYLQSTSPWYLPTSAVEGRLLGCGRYAGAAGTRYHGDDEASPAPWGFILRKGWGHSFCETFLWEENGFRFKSTCQEAIAPKEISSRGVQTNQQTVQEGEILFQKAWEAILK